MFFPTRKLKVKNQKALAYADDVLIFLTRPTELQTLLHLVSLYGKASNARLNRGKTLAVSLSGEDHQDWRQMLSANGITQWHDKRASSATIYLGYPLTSSAQQMSTTVVHTRSQHGCQFTPP
ncbi:hypothetical protein G6F52_009382 [Rhizopus delemar]|nr:hypothetical protein G6F52_009382 [Rhizopus delemar]